MIQYKYRNITFTTQTYTGELKMRNYSLEVEKRVEFIKELLKNSGADGIVYGNSGGKDCALVGILCKLACDNTVGLILPCGKFQQKGDDVKDAQMLAEKFNIQTRIFDITDMKDMFISSLGKNINLSESAKQNIPPRLRMTALYTVAASENRLVAGTSNKSERYMGYFTKHGDGAYDFNPIADLTATEVFEFLRYLKVPARIIEKPPSAGLFEGQTDEKDMGVTYHSIDSYLLTGNCPPQDLEIIEKFHRTSAHKRKLPALYGGN